MVDNGINAIDENKYVVVVGVIKMMVSFIQRGLIFIISTCVRSPSLPLRVSVHQLRFYSALPGTEAAWRKFYVLS